MVGSSGVLLASCHRLRPDRRADAAWWRPAPFRLHSRRVAGRLGNCARRLTACARTKAAAAEVPSLSSMSVVGTVQIHCTSELTSLRRARSAGRRKGANSMLETRNPALNRAACLLRLNILEIIEVDALYFNDAGNSHPNIELDHEAGQCFAINQNKAQIAGLIGCFTSALGKR